MIRKASNGYTEIKYNNISGFKCSPVAILKKKKVNTVKYAKLLWHMLHKRDVGFKV